MNINPKGSPRIIVPVKALFLAKPVKNKMNKIEELSDINVDIFRPENQHLLERWERNLNSDPWMMLHGVH